MNTLLSIRTNIMYAKKDGEFKRYQELIFLVDRPIYRQTNEDEIIRERSIEEMRFTVSEAAYDTLLKALTDMKEIDETDLT